MSPVKRTQTGHDDPWQNLACAPERAKIRKRLDGQVGPSEEVDCWPIRRCGGVSQKGLRDVVVFRCRASVVFFCILFITFAVSIHPIRLTEPAAETLVDSCEQLRIKPNFWQLPAKEVR